MEAPMNYICFLVFVVLLSIVGLNGIDGARECGMNSSPDTDPSELDPCDFAALNQTSAVSDECCQLVKEVDTNPSFLCAIILSKEAKKAGVTPEVAMTLPMRCNITNRPIGYECGGVPMP